jgi:predicted ATPase/DNA-binding CsgD family transcriptional regulator
VTPGAGDLLALLTEYLGARCVLLVLDNCEHVVDDVALLVERLVRACPNLRVLCTSRAPLDLGAEVAYRVEPLPKSADAVQLFLERARAAAPDIAFTAADVAVLAQICDRLDRLPLAIELAAPWLRMMMPAELWRRLSEGLDVVAGNRRDLPARQRTIRATLEHSYRLLDVADQILFRRLAVFAGSFAAQAVEDVCSLPPVDRPMVVERLTRLRDRSMLVVERQVTGPTRYRLLETLRGYAALELAASRENAALQRRHFGYYLALAERIDRDRHRTGSDHAVGTLVADEQNLRAALAWGLEHEPVGALRLAAALEAFWMIRSVAEGRDWLRHSLAAVPDGAAARARALIVSPLVVAGGIPWPEARRMIATSKASYDAQGDREGSAMADLTMALSALFNGELDEAQRVVEEALRVYDDIDGVLFHARAITYLGAVLSLRPGSFEGKRRVLAEAAAYTTRVGDSWAQGLALTMLGLTELRAGNRPAALRSLQAALRGRMRGGVTASAVGAIGMSVLDSDPRLALTLLDAATAIRDRAGVGQFPVPLQREFTRGRAAAERRLSAATVRRCRLRGRTLSTADALALASAQADPTPVGQRLTVRQEEVTALVADGLTNREIAAELQLSVRTVETHVNNVLTQLNLHSRGQLADWVQERGAALIGPGTSELT